ncbi:acyl-CoA thioesterase [Mucilaginibacter gynuensis]|uniref:Acyl-CoA thioesterase n=1 Tax=Mucilaginibacter gynuensis TaxID=1302236 RepID=A0ABP8FUY3_9SPHI
MAERTFKPAKNSETVITELMIPSYTNFGGKIHGGVLLSMMDKVAYACAMKHTGYYCVTASIDEVNFIAPVEIGQLVSMLASVNYTGNTSVVVGIRVQSEDVRTNIITHTNTSYFTMVAMDNNKTVPVPGLILETQTELRRYFEAMQRKVLKKYYRDEFARIKTPDDIAEYKNLMESENCRIKF